MRLKKPDQPEIPSASQGAPDFNSLFREAERTLQEGQTRLGRELLEKLNDLYPANVRVLNRLGLVCQMEGQIKDAMAFFLAAVKGDPKDRTGILNLAGGFEAVGNFEEASSLLFYFMDGKAADQDILQSLIRIDEKFYDELLSKCSRVGDARFRKRDFTVSAIVSTYASADFICECLEDLEAQTWANRLEIIVVDAASPQDEKRIVEEFQQRFDNIRYLRTPTRIGIYPAWNLAIRAATGKYILPFSTNDRLAPNACQMLAEALEANPLAALAYGDTYLTDLPHQKFGQHIPSADENGAFIWPEYSYEFMLVSCCVGPHPMWRRDVHEVVGYFDGRYKAIGDQDFWLRLGRHFPFQHIPEFTGLAWLTKESLSGQSNAGKEILEIHTKYIQSYKESRGRIAGVISEKKISGDKSDSRNHIGAMKAGESHTLLPLSYGVSAIVYTYNSEMYFQGCIQNLVEQSLFQKGEMEIIILDNGSTQHAGSMVREFINSHANIIYMHTKMESVHAARNRMSLAARGRYLVYANAEDRHKPDAFEIMACELDSRPVSLVYSDALLTHIPNETFAKNSAKMVWSLPDYNVRQALAGNPFGGSVMWRRGLHSELGLFDENLRFAGDYEFFLKASLNGGAYHIPQPLCLYFESTKNPAYGQPLEVNQEIGQFLLRFRIETPLNSIYPFLGKGASSRDFGMAAMDFGNLMLNPNIMVGYSEAEYFFLEAAKHLGPLPEVQNNLAVALGYQGKYAEAGQVLQDAIKSFPGLEKYVNTSGSLPQASTLFILPYPKLEFMSKVKFGAQLKLPIAKYQAAETFATI